MSKHRRQVPGPVARDHPGAHRAGEAGPESPVIAGEVLHRSASARHHRPSTSHQLREVVVWMLVAVVLVPVAMHWAGAGWSSSAGMGALLLLLAGLCAAALLATARIGRAAEGSDPSRGT
ncbi:MAG: hypothetical protein QOE01_2395 [Actinomycetota bacterium]|nr:hypothetical protein [Actinomycetota bacterium]